MPDQTTWTIRDLGPADLALCRGMLALFARAFDEPETYEGAQPDDAYLSDLLGQGHFIALVAIRDDKVVGALAAYELRKFERVRSELYIYDLAVDERHRRQGIATALIVRLRAIGSARGAWTIFVQADPPDAPAIALYDRLGVREPVLHFDIPVG